jgi:DNA replication protein DnaC
MAEPVPSQCARCGGSFYLCYPSEAVAVARACECQACCPACGGTGFLLRAGEGGYDYATTCRCRALEFRLNRFNSAGIPAKFHDRSLFNYQPDSKSQQAVQTALYQFLRGFQAGARGFLLMGPVGTGKTHLLCAVLSYLSLELGVITRFVDFFHLLQDLREGFSQNRSASELLAPLEQVPVLAIDELGKGRNTEWELSILDEVISKRYNQQRTTLFTTNYTDDPDTTFVLAIQDPKAGPARTPKPPNLERRVLRETLEERVGPRIYSRLREMCSFYTVAGPDHRARAASETAAPAR